MAFIDGAVVWEMAPSRNKLSKTSQALKLAMHRQTGCRWLSHSRCL
ncbi:hypothetical protein O9992_23910 [Vibrio lentus]|nr:hypothetical protein [Vibrio lentus]